MQEDNNEKLTLAVDFLRRRVQQLFDQTQKQQKIIAELQMRAEVNGEAIGGHSRLLDSLTMHCFGEHCFGPFDRPAVAPRLTLVAGGKDGPADDQA